MISVMYSQVWVFNGTFKLQMRQDSYPHQAPPRRVSYALQVQLKEELDRLQKQQIIVPLDAEEISEWCSSLVLLPKSNSKVRLCLDPSRLNNVIKRPIHRGTAINNILPRLAGGK